MRVSMSDVRYYTIETLWREVYPSIRYKMRLRKDNEHLLNYVIEHPSDKEAYCSLYAALKMLVSWEDLQVLERLYGGASVDIIHDKYSRWHTHCSTFELDSKVKEFIRLRILDILEDLIDRREFREEHLDLLNKTGFDDVIREKLVNYIVNNRLVGMCTYLHDKDIALEIINRLIKYDYLSEASSFLKCTPALRYLVFEMEQTEIDLKNILNALKEKESITTEGVDNIYNELRKILQKYYELDNTFSEFNMNMLEYVLDYKLRIKTLLNDVFDEIIGLREYYEEKTRKIKKMFVLGTIDEKTYKQTLTVLGKIIDKINTIMTKLLSKHINVKEIKNRLKVLEEMYMNGEITESEYKYMKQQLESIIKYIK